MALAYGSSFELSPGVRKIFFGHSGALSHWKERWVRLCLQMSFYDCVSLFCYQRFSPSKKTQPHLCFPQQKNRKHARLICNTRRPEKRFGNKNYLHSFRLLHLFHKTNRARSLPPTPRTPSPPALPPSLPTEKTSEKTLPEGGKAKAPARDGRRAQSECSDPRLLAPQSFGRKNLWREGRERLGASQASLSRGFVPRSEFLAAARTGVRRELVVAYFLNCGVLAS